MQNVGTVPTYKTHIVGTIPTYKMHNIGTKLSYATLSTIIKFNSIKLDLIKGNQIILNKMKLDILWQKTTFDGRRPLTEDTL